MKKKETKKSRVWELDFLRGFSILMVALDHTMFDLAYLYFKHFQTSGNDFLATISNFAKSSYYGGTLRVIFWPVFVFIFFFVSGICTRFTKNNFLRAIKITAAALVVNIASYILERVLMFDGSLVIFGVLNCLASCLLIYAVISLLLGLIKNNYVRGGILIGISIIVFVINSIYNVSLFQVSGSNLMIETDNLLAGFFVYTTGLGRMTADYFPLMPFVGFFLLGAGLSQIIYRKNQSLLPKLDRAWHRPITFFGRHSLIIYLSIQVVAIVLLSLISLILTGSLGII